MSDNNITSRLRERMKLFGKWNATTVCLLSTAWLLLLFSCVDDARQIQIPHNGTVQPPEDTVNTPDDTAQKPDDTPRPTDGTSEPPDDTAQTPDDTTEPPDDTAQTPDDTTEPPDDTAQTPDDTAQTPDDATQSPDDTAQTPDGATQSPDDTVEPPAAPIEQVAAGATFSCAIRNDTVYCWGRGLKGQLGNGFGSSHPQPQSIRWVFQRVPQRLVLGGNVGCLFDDGDRLYCWGAGAYGQLGVNSTADRYSATPLYQANPVPARFDSASIGGSHSCSLAFNYTIWCWGSSYYGQLGNNSFDDSKSKPSTLIPRQVTSLPRGVRYPVSISSGAHHSCAIINDGSVYCWGHAYYGQLGNACLFNVPDGHISCNDDKATPQKIALFDSITDARFAVSIASGANHTCVLTKDGSLYCFGKGESGQLGNSETNNYTTPMHIGSVGKNTKAMALGDNHTCLLLNNGTIQCFGHNGRGQLGINSTASKHTPVQALFPSGTQLLGVTAGAEHTCAWNSDSVWCWGDNKYGQIGNGSVDNIYPRPQLITLPE